MEETINRFKKEIESIDKFLIIFISLIPLMLAMSIFAADFLASLSGLILIIILFKKKNLQIFSSIKKEIIYFLFFYTIIIISLLLSNYKEQSFLASFFYFRYFLLSLSIFYLLKKYKFFKDFFYVFFLISIFIVVTDSIFQYLFKYNSFGYQLIGTEDYGFRHLTGFFNTEKKLGSYLVRFLPLMIGLTYLYKKKIHFKYEFITLLILGVIVFLSSERTALLLLFIVYFFYLIFSKYKIYIFVSLIILFTLLFSQNESFYTKYTIGTSNQIGLIYLFEESPRPIDKDFMRYYSYEHENLTYTGFVNFNNNPFFGSGVKTFFQECKSIEPKYQFKINKRNNRLTCSTHPHSLYVQILSETGIFAFLLIFFVFAKTLFKNLQILFLKKNNYLNKSIFFINLSVIINLMPLIPSGSFYNNWMSLIMFFPLGFWLYINNKDLK